MIKQLKLLIYWNGYFSMNNRAFLIFGVEGIKGQIQPLLDELFNQGLDSNTKVELNEYTMCLR